ncbi:DUF2529 family protein [Jeotgalibacillus marinus]|uniref:DUF2529 family protein n=1 Tax=Jeotgalibacillus marinus TaxID=86667 RepID=A0ABV3Q0P7_9BACL
MLKMFTTQLSGLFLRIHGKEEMEIEDAARLLAQAAVGEGTIFIKGYREMNGVVSEALTGEEPLQGMREFVDIDELSGTDRVLLVTRRSTDEEALKLGAKLVEKDIPFVTICGVVKNSEHDLLSMANVCLNTQVVKGMLPHEDGGRFGFPSLIAALYLYHGVKFTLEEMVEEY